MKRMNWLKKWFRSKAKDKLGMRKYTSMSPEEADIRNQEILGIRKDVMRQEQEIERSTTTEGNKTNE